MKPLRMMLYENGVLSTTRLIAVVSFLLFACVSLYLVYTGKTWGHYETFSTLTGGGGLLTQVTNKLINGKYNSEQGKPFLKEGEI